MVYSRIMVPFNMAKSANSFGGLHHENGLVSPYSDSESIEIILCVLGAVLSVE
jgi:hypothetical protein